MAKAKTISVKKAPCSAAQKAVDTAMSEMQAQADETVKSLEAPEKNSKKKYWGPKAMMTLALVAGSILGYGVSRKLA